MSKNLMDLIDVVSEVLDKHHIICYLCWGSLLGYIRSNDLPPQDYDVDIVMNPNDYDRIMALKDEFKERGYTLYGKNDILPFFFYKKKMTIISFRLYNDKTHYFLEFFEGYKVPAKGIEYIMKRYPKVEVPTNYRVNDTYVCTGRRETFKSTEFCFYYDDIYPLRRVKAFKEQYSMFIPNKPHNILKQVYGSTYMIPQTKGYKSVVCYTKPKYTLSVITAIYLLLNSFFLLFTMRI